jgi:uncharacterized membrane protein
MWFFMFFITLIIPFTMVGFGRYFSKGGPEKINLTFGYRTTRSMRNQETWAFAHRYCGKLWVRMGLILLPVTVIAMLFVLGEEQVDRVAWYGLGVTVVQMVFLFATIFLVERALKKTFDDRGNRRVPEDDPME